MNIRWLVLFSAVAEEGSFTRAANRLNVAQPWVSAQVRKLEFELGVDLLERTKSGIALTRAGRELLPHATQVAEGARRFRDLARTMGDVRSKVVRLGSHAPLVGLPPLRRLNLEFQKRYASFSLETERAATPALIVALEEGLTDCAACLGPIATGRRLAFDVLEIARTRPYLLMTRDVALTSDADLTGVTIGAPDEALQPDYFRPLYAALEARGASLRLAPEAGREAMIHFVRQQRGVALMIEGEAGDHADDPELRALPIAGDDAVTLLLRVADREPGRAALRFWDLAAATFAAPLMATRP